MPDTSLPSRNAVQHPRRGLEGGGEGEGEMIDLHLLPTTPSPSLREYRAKWYVRGRGLP